MASRKLLLESRAGVYRRGAAEVPWIVEDFGCRGVARDRGAATVLSLTIAGSLAGQHTGDVEMVTPVVA
jgi:hypothetical protein